MFGQPGYSRTMSANVREIERRLRSMEKRLERAGVRTSASAVETADHVGDSVAAVLSSLADRFRGGANSMGDEAASGRQRISRAEGTYLTQSEALP
jgi:hypothetical protein